MIMEYTHEQYCDMLLTLGSCKAAVPLALAIRRMKQVALDTEMLAMCCVLNPVVANFPEIARSRLTVVL
jgi:hypothetical protein